MLVNPYLFLIIPALLAWFAQGRVRKVYQAYRNIPNRQHLSGLEIAQQLLGHYGLTHVTFEQALGRLTDHYNTQTRKLHLTNESVNSRSITAMGIVAHEVRHPSRMQKDIPF